MATLKTDEGKMLTVDMGSPKSDQEIQQGSKVTVAGVPVEVGDRVVLIADQNQTSLQ